LLLRAGLEILNHFGVLCFGLWAVFWFFCFALAGCAGSHKLMAAATVVFV
jgi:hypothetical protein